MSSHALLRVGEEVDLYYTDPKNCEKQSIPVEYNTRFTQAMSNLQQGVSVYTIPPGNGIRHVLIVVGYSSTALAANAVANGGLYALPRGWGYQAIKQISFRVGGSSQYFLSGDQLLARNLRLCRTQSQRDSMLQLGGAECKVPADFATDQFAYIPVSVFASPSADGISLPLAGDLLSQQIQITAEIAPTSDFWITNPNPAGGGAGSAGTIPPAFTTGYFQVEQLVMEDRGMSLANRVDLNTHSYNMPLPDFDQQEVIVPLASVAVGAAAAGGTPVVLTGFRAGEVKKLQIWLTKDTDALNPGRWYKPKAVQALYAGTIYANYADGAAAMWNLLDGTSRSAAEQSALAASSAPGVMVSAPVLSEWTELPFAQPTGNDYDGEVLVHGKQITNGIVNLQVQTPDTSAYTLHIVYVYNCTLSMSKGSADLIF